MRPPPFERVFRFDDGAGDGFLDVPPSPGVALFEAPDGQPVQLLTSADLRQLVRTRLDPDHTKGSARSLIGAATRVRTRLSESDAERRLLWILLAHEHLPRIADDAARTPPCWFLLFDHRDEFPKAVPLGARELGGMQDLVGVFGPYPSRRAAARAGEAITDTLDLCRHHHLLVLAPHASACAYKDMGRCPAPCDGTESMASYRARVELAQAWLTAPEEHRAEAEDSMRDAASSLDYERASACKQTLDRSAPLIEQASGAIDGRSWCAMVPATPAGTVALYVVAPGVLRRVAECVTPEDCPASIEARTPISRPLTALDADVLGWWGEQACLPPDRRTGRRSVEIIPLPSDASILERAAKTVLERAAQSPPIE